MYALRKSLKGLKYKKQKKENWMFCKVYKENQKELEKCTTSIVCVWVMFDLQQKQTTKGKIDFLSTIKRSYCPLSPIPPAVLCTILCCWFRVVAILPFRVLNRVSVWAVKVDEEQSIVTFLVLPFFPLGFFHVSLSLKANLILYAKWNESEL